MSDEHRRAQHDDKPWLGADPVATQEWRRRWYRARAQEAQERGFVDAQGTPRHGQCGGCRYFIPLTGALIDDWGACSNPVSVFDGAVMFEHLGCDVFAQARDDWGGPHRSYDHRHGQHYTHARAIGAARERQQRISEEANGHESTAQDAGC